MGWGFVVLKYESVKQKQLLYLQVVEEISRQFLLLDSTYNNDGDLIQPKHTQAKAVRGACEHTAISPV